MGERKRKRQKGKERQRKERESESFYDSSAAVFEVPTKQG